MGKIAKNHEDWSVPEPPPSPKKRGMLVLIPEDMQEAKKSIKEKGIKAKYVKNLPPIEKLCEPTTHPPLVEVHSLLEFNESDILMSTHASILVDYVGPPSAEVCRTTAISLKWMT